jgi:hypothetical protein
LIISNVNFKEMNNNKNIGYEMYEIRFEREIIENMN